MANYNTLKTAIQAVIKENNNNEITGTDLQNALVSMINSLGAGYQFVGIATPTTNPGTPDQNVFYIASQNGTYANFGGLSISNEVAIFAYNGQWQKLTTGITSDSKINQLILELFESGYKFGGVVTPNDEPLQNTIERMFYIAKDNGIYTNFGGIEVNNETIVILQSEMSAGNFTGGKYLYFTTIENIRDNELWGYTDFIPYESGNDVIWDFGVNEQTPPTAMIGFYDENKNYIRDAYWTNTSGGAGEIGSRTIQASAITTYAPNAKYLRASFHLNFSGAKITIGNNVAWIPIEETQTWQKQTISSNVEIDATLNVETATNSKASGAKIVAQKFELLNNAVFGNGGSDANYTKGKYLTSTGELWPDEEWGVTDFIPCTKNNNINLGNKTTAASKYAWFYDANKQLISGAYWALQTIERPISKDVIATYAPNCAYIRTSFKLNDGSKLLVDNVVAWEQIDLSAGGLENRMAKAELDIEELQQSSGDENVSYRNKIEQLKRPRNDANVLKWPLLVMGVLTDIHADGINLNRFISFCDKYSISNRLHMGDSLNGNFVDSFAFWLNADASNILNVIGNHDTSEAASGSTPRDWNAHSGLEVYNKIFAPYIADWGVTQPNGASENGYCFYYKDFANEKVRLIVIDCMIGNRQTMMSTQLSWFAETLTGAKTNGYSVVVVKHTPNKLTKDASNHFNTLDYDTYGDILYGFNSGPYYDAVDTFINDGGDFICWLGGDSHYDYQGVITGHTNQYSIAFECGQCSSYWTDSARIRGQLSQDSFNILGFDTYNHLIKIIRIGNNCDRYLRFKNSIVINYQTKDIVSKQF